MKENSLRNLGESNFQSEKEKKILFFDWDDTLFPTSYLNIFQLDYKRIFLQEIEVQNYIDRDLKELEQVKFLIKNFRKFWNCFLTSWRTIFLSLLSRTETSAG
jgi:hypothetical protein